MTEDFRAYADSLQSLLPDDLPPSLILGISPPALSDILLTVADFYQIRPTAVIYEGTHGEHGPRKSSFVRHVICYLARTMTRCSHEQIARVLGYRNFSTVHYSRLKIDGMAVCDEILRDDLDILQRRLADQAFDKWQGGAVCQ